MEPLPDEHAKRFVAVLHKKIEVGKAMNALGHITAGLVGGLDDVKELHFLTYKDKNGGVHPNISHYPFIVLKANNANEIRNVRNECIKRNIPFCDFTSTMSIGTSEQQLRATESTPEEVLEYWGIVFFGNTEEIKEFTKKFSLY